MEAHSDVFGFCWDDTAIIGQTSKRGQKRIPAAPPRPDWTPPTEFPSFKDRPRIGLDLETFDPDLFTKGPGVRRDGYICGVALGLGPNVEDALYYPVAHKGPNLDKKTVYGWLRDEAKDFRGEIVGANLTYDLDYLAEVGVHFPHAKIRDVQIAEPLLDELQYSYSLNRIAETHLGEKKHVDELAELYGDGYITRMPDIWSGHAATYAAGDVSLPWRIIDKQIALLEQQNLTGIFEIESRLPPLLLHMRRVGVPVDIAKAEQVSAELTQRFNQQLKAMPQHVDVWAADSLARLFDAQSIEYPRTEKTGKPSFTRAWLEACPAPIAQQIVELRKLDKLKGTFIDGYIINSHINGRLHCQFNQLRSDRGGAVSGRFSSSNPNLQNIPVRDPWLGPLIRSMFIPEEGMLWGSADWSQIEFRFLVHWAKAAGLRSADAAAELYRNDRTTDFHAMAAELTGLERTASKAINFGVVYGMGVATMAANLNLPLDEASEILATFHERLPFVKKISDMAANRARQKGFITTISGRRRRYPGGDGAHAALNGLLQGSAADLMKKSMIDMWDAGVFNTGLLVPHLTVHDEMAASIPQTPAGQEAWKELIHTMENCMKLHVPVIADAKTGANWSEAK